MIARPMNAIPVIALSAIGSAILPKLVIRLCLRARSPSILSVIIARQNSTHATQRQPIDEPPSCSSAQPKNGTITMRSVVSALGTFQLLTSRACSGAARAGSSTLLRTCDRDGRRGRRPRSRPPPPESCHRPPHGPVRPSSVVDPSTSGPWCAARPSTHTVRPPTRRGPRPARRSAPRRAGRSAPRPGRSRGRPARRSRPRRACPRSARPRCRPRRSSRRSRSRRAAPRLRKSHRTSRSVLGLPREADDEVRAGARLGSLRPRLVEQPEERLGVAEAAHPAQHRVRGVLEGQVEVRRHARRRGDRGDQPRTRLGGLEVGHPHPLDPVDGGQLGQQRLQQAQVAEVLAVGGGVLRDQEQLPGSLRRPASGPRRARRRAGARRTSRGRPGSRRRCSAGRSRRPASAAPSVRRRAATLRRSDRVRAGTPARRPAPPGRSAAAGAGPAACAGAGSRRPGSSAAGRRCRGSRRSRARRRPPAARWPARRRTARPGSPRPPRPGCVPGVLEVGRGQQRVDRVLLGRLDEAAGVHHDGLGVLGVLDEPEAAGLEPSGELLGVDLVAGAAERHHRDGGQRGSGAGEVCRSSHEPCRV